MHWSKLFCCSVHSLPFRVVDADGLQEEVPESGELVCACGCRIRIERGVPCCVPHQDYSSSFGFEWNQYPRLQLDSNTGISLSSSRLERCLGRPLSSLAGLDILEAGCGSGRFSEVMLNAGARLCALDLSDAVEANYSNHHSNPNFFVVQADLRDAPYSKRSFDVVICLGVLQHTPNPAASISALALYAKPGGLVVVDNYNWSLRRVMALRYLYRAWLKHVGPVRAHEICQRMVDRWLPIHRRASKNPVAHALLSRVSPITSYYHRYNLNDELQRSFAYLDTFDFHTPRYERLRTPYQISRAMCAAGLIDVKVNRGGNGVEARGTAPTCAE
jgi:2-polyprenyl-3-methyl-5-hydroxy-6-metoxy-1,4-benzoquinol methylase